MTIYGQNDHPFSEFRGETYAESISKLRICRKALLKSSAFKPAVAILGAGPAGLLRAIQSLALGNSTFVVEKRAENAEGRFNAVALDPLSIDRLKKFGIYQYLLENELIFPEKKKDPNSNFAIKNAVTVRLRDLENAMKAVIKDLTDEPVIKYDRTVTDIKAIKQNIRLNTPAKTHLHLISKTGIQEVTLSVDLIVNAEGRNSSTNKLLRIERVEILPSIPVIAAIYKDKMADVSDDYSHCQYLMNKTFDTVNITYNYASYLYKTIFEGERFWKFGNNQIAGSAILKTPGQNYLGTALSKEGSDKLRLLNDAVIEKKASIKSQAEKNLSEDDLESLNEDLKTAEKELESYVKYWSGLSFCDANLTGIADNIFGEKNLETAYWLPFDSYAVVEIGVDKASVSNVKLDNDTVILLTGDALATVDPSTGLGCNFAIQSSDHFLDFVDGLTNKTKYITTLRNIYHEAACKEIIEKKSQSKAVRRLYRPDTMLKDVNG